MLKTNLMKKIFLFLAFALLFLSACLIGAQQTESTPDASPTFAPNASAPTPKQIRPTLHWETSNPKTPTATATPTWKLPAFSAADRSIYLNGLAPEYQSAAENGLPSASLYSIDFIIADELYRLAGSETVIYTNAENVELNEINFRLYPNLLGGEMRVSKISIDKKSVVPTYSLNDSLLTLPLKIALQPQESVVVSMDFTATISQTVDFNHGVQSYYDATLSLAHAYPVIAVYDAKGWNAEIPSRFGDVLYADASFFVVTVDAPKRITLVASGYEAQREEIGNRQKVAYIAGPARDFYLAASSEYQVFTKDANGIALRFYARASVQVGAEYALNVAARALAIFSEKYAPYPYRELDFVATSTTAGGMEYPGAIAVAKEYLSASDFYLESVVAHEVGHQWFYNLVGNNQLSEPWLDESLTQFAALQYFDVQGQALFRRDMENRWNAIDRRGIPVGLPVNAYSHAEYSGIIYGRGGLFFEALRDSMSVKNFDAFFKDYVQSSLWGIATTEKLKTTAETHCACDLTPLFAQWIYP